jgi:hypothetical protein
MALKICHNGDFWSANIPSGNPGEQTQAADERYGRQLSEVGGYLAVHVFVVGSVGHQLLADVAEAGARAVAGLKTNVQAGVNVMVTFFGDFRQFSAEKIGVFLENLCHGQCFA